MTDIEIQLDKNVPVPLYYQLKTAILDNIKSGTYEQGSMIPKEQDFCEILDISRTTVRQAITELVHEGWLYRVKSKGTFVAKPKLKQDFIKRLESYNAQISRLHMTPSTKVITMSVMPATEEIAENLNIRIADSVIILQRVRYADQEAIVTLRTYLPYESCEFVMSHDFGKESLYSVLSQKEETRICMVHRTIEATEADREDVKYMDIKQGKPIQLFHTVGYNGQNRPIEYSIAHYRGDRSKFDVNIYVDNQ